MEDFTKDVVALTAELAQAAGIPILVTLGLLLVASMLLVAARHLGGLSWPKADPPDPPAPESEWNQDPTKGAVVVPGPPGGSDDQFQGG